MWLGEGRALRAPSLGLQAWTRGADRLDDVRWDGSWKTWVVSHLLAQRLVWNKHPDL